MIHADFPTPWLEQQLKLIGMQHVSVLETSAIGACALAGLGGVLIALNLLPRLGCVFLLAFLVPVTYFQHFLPMQAAESDEKKQLEMIMVMKNVALFGAA